MMQTLVEPAENKSHLAVLMFIVKFVIRIGSLAIA